MDTELLLATLVFLLPMCFTPGPNNVLCAAHGSQHGFRESLPMISGMAVGWSTLGLIVAAATGIIENNQRVFDLITYLGVAFIAYLSFTIASSKPLEEGERSKERIGFYTGLALQFVNGKAYIHFGVLMTSFGSVFGTDFFGKAALVLLNLACGLPAVMTWTASGTILRRAFTTPESARILNLAMGGLLLVVAVWLIIPANN